MLTSMSTSLHHRAVEHLGTRIVDGSLPPGHVMLAEQLEEELQVSRSVIREAVRVLQSLGLVETTKRVGIKVLPELRSAVEPVAAELAAVNAPQELRQELLDVALAMREAGKAGDVPRFLELDIQFHSLLLSGSGN